MWEETLQELQSQGAPCGGRSDGVYGQVKQLLPSAEMAGANAGKAVKEVPKDEKEMASFLLWLWSW